MSWIVWTSLPFVAYGAAVGRWWAALLPLVGWPLFVLGRYAEWWGSGVGDGWEYGLALLTVGGVVATLIGVAGRRFLGSRLSGRRRSGIAHASGSPPPKI